MKCWSRLNGCVFFLSTDFDCSFIDLIILLYHCEPQALFKLCSSALLYFVDENNKEIEMKRVKQCKGKVKKRKSSIKCFIFAKGPVINPGAGWGPEEVMQGHKKF